MNAPKVRAAPSASLCGGSSKVAEPHLPGMGANLLQSLLRQKAAITEEFFVVLDTVALEGRVDAIRLMNHIHIVDQIFAAHLRGEPHGFKATNTPETPALDGLRSAVRETDRWFVEQAGSLTPAQRSETLAFTFTDGQRGRMSREEMLAHVITHGSYHRGEVGQMLKRLSAAPPRDLFTAYLHRTEPQRRGPSLGADTFNLETAVDRLQPLATPDER